MSFARWAALAAFAAAVGAGAVRAQGSAAAGAYWMRLYPASQFSEIWRLSLIVGDVDKASAKAVVALEKNGGQPLLPKENMASSRTQPFQQFSYKLPAKNGSAVLKALQKLGETESLHKNPGVHPGVVEEVSLKLEKLKAETEPNKEALDKMPSVRAAVDEIKAHLEEIAAANRDAKSRILLNLELRQKK